MGVKNQKMRNQKMILNLNDKNKYVVHIRTPQILPEAWIESEEDTQSNEIWTKRDIKTVHWI